MSFPFSGSVMVVLTSIASQIFWLTKFSTDLISLAVIGSIAVKSKRKKSGSTKLPA